jgi:hypothetical protein
MGWRFLASGICIHEEGASRLSRGAFRFHFYVQIRAVAH